MQFLVCLLFFASGATALILETLWFRQAGLGLGNTVWASSLVLSSFMAGLCLGSAGVARRGHRIRNPLRTYALLELAIALSGPILTLVLPHLGAGLAPVFEGLGERGPLLAVVRLTLAFALLLIPATAMGATLPVLTKALFARDPQFGQVLGKLYGWNTFGAVAGGLLGELVLTPRLGVRGTALVAAGLGCAAAGGAAVLAARMGRGSPAPDPDPGPHRPPPPLSTNAKRILVAAGLCGAALLAFEVVWFRFLLLFMSSTSGAFAVMLAVVLSGIAGGGLAGSALLRVWPAAHRVLPAVVAVAGLSAVVSYASFDPFVASLGGYSIELAGTTSLSLRLMLPVSLASGLVFTLQGAALHAELADAQDGETRAAGLLTLSNTFGGLLGAAAAGFVLLPMAGLERSFFLLSAVYLLVTACLWIAPARSPRERLALLAPGAALVAALGLFPWGDLHRKHLPISGQAYRAVDGSYLAALEEGANCTVRCLRTDFMGEPLHYRLLTNGYSMSGSLIGARRYMKLYVQIAMALRPQAERALLIGYGVGQTAKALSETASLREIHVTDPTPEILAMSPVIFPDPKQDPLRDPRVSLHVEDGRFFLQTTSLRFDLITGEPPPPKAAGIVALYTRDHFQLLHDRLSDEGIVTYWLPGASLNGDDARAIVKAFLEVFDDATLWQGWGLNMMLVGRRNGSTPEPPSEEAFTRQWRDPVVGPELEAVALEVPEQLGAMFLADAPTLRERLADVEPLTDNDPYRLSPSIVPPDRAWGDLGPWLNEAEAREVFKGSEWVKAWWPAGLRERTLPWFEIQTLVNQAPSLVGGVPPLAQVDQALKRPELKTLVLWLLGSGVLEQRILERVGPGRSPALASFHLGARAMAERRFADAARLFGAVARSNPQAARARLYQAYAAGLAGDLGQARAVLTVARQRDDVTSESWTWLVDRYGL